MPLELAEVVAGFPLAASFAIATGITAFREGRRRTSLNEAVHELRRPLQVLALSLPTDSGTSGALDSSLRMAAAAVDRLEREINGKREMGEAGSVSLQPLVRAAVERWRPRAELTGRSLDLCWRVGEPLLRGDEVELDQAVDNLISNALEHGRGDIKVEVREAGDNLHLAVLDRGPLPASAGESRSERGRPGGRARHGHGLRIVRRTAARHGGGFELRRSSRGTEARLELAPAAAR